ncbi:tyrosine-type recombinase/integrase [Carnobacterium maltaromaticum]|uniref:Tyrosine-type recombinase/integrase n=1 Tax=Carnobacterium maltaromaticum TaxID=2751 RepID=A0AAW9JYZ2_CARML|nr:tyrosine-type recombinase/integrase [Carnobacterium maltaromaticum]MDZ5760793.1 tyrosine-type recombinase/integrase [Carnobacterium maltaromaticum]
MNDKLLQKINNASPKMVPLYRDYWKNDVWLIHELPIKSDQDKLKTQKTINFNYITNAALCSEVKYYLWQGLEKEWWLLSTLKQTKIVYFKSIILFLQETYPNMSSVTDQPLDILEKQFKKYLIKIGKSLVRAHTDGKRRNQSLNLLTSFYIFYDSLYDERLEYERDKWRIEQLNIPYNMSRRDKYIHFGHIQQPFRELIKRYLKESLLIQQQITINTAFNVLKKLNYFFDYLKITYPDWVSLRELNRKDIESFLCYLRENDMGGRSSRKNRLPSDRHIAECLSNLRKVILHMQTYSWEEAPLIEAKALIYTMDFPNRRRKNYEDHIKHIPDEVWNQVVQNLDSMNEVVGRIVLTMEASGFRISDTCQLSKDCLIYKENGWWLKGDQQKVKQKDHIVPISEEIAGLIKFQIEWIEQNIPLGENPHNFLFPEYIMRKNKGKAFSQQRVAGELNVLARKLPIVDSNGEVYKFRNHAFRHRYGMKMINNGMSILHVQKLMAHTSPEMTLSYARILDSTLRQEWEKVHKAVKLDNKGLFISTSVEEHAVENNLEIDWIRHNLDSVRLDHGFCIKSPKLKCEFLDQCLEFPCIKNKCRSFHVNDSFTDYYEREVLQMESDIARYKEQNRLRSTELLLPKLQQYQEILCKIQTEKGINGLTKNEREYTREERTKW